MQVAVRADASAAMGLGHLQRCLSLALALRSAGAEVVFVSRDLGLDLAAQLRGLALVLLPADGGPHVPWEQDAQQTVAALAAAPPAWIVVDHYALDARWHAAVAAALHAEVAVVDDLADRPLQAGLLVDHNLAAPDHRHKYGRCIAPTTPILGGPRYALLAPAYAAAPRHRFQARVRSIGVFMGGTDGADASTLVLRALREHAGFAGPVEIATTSANPHRAALARLAGQWPNTTLLLDQPDLASFFARHDLQIGAGGGALWERCCIGAPTLALAVAPNQQHSIPLLGASGAVATLPPGAPLAIDTVGAAVARLIADAAGRQRLHERSLEWVDGRGAQRVALRLLAAQVGVRPVRLADRDLLLRWRNHAVVRAASRNGAPIAPAAHAAWLDRVLADPSRSLWVGQVGAIPVGSVRFDRLDDRRAEVSIHLDPELLGLGLGGPLLAAAETQYRTMQPSSTTLYAEVLAGNTASARLFEAAGYAPAGKGWTKPLQPGAAA
ncbi:UDP-2,4-diacetamido-2,4, 6-trideoxy-beta-L-altropyranose hydrolase [Pseudorhodoferax sp. LjRoot39]|uniref:UDP-2,4-diacetamido-2,4, 6-trideoxy-beta-L-altropyranose hydrolase n=1 Tax=Pseudorhodoferax sp. LjRoot39 TaxID=3342328 RepID=UPI003ECF29E7